MKAITRRKIIDTIYRKINDGCHMSVYILSNEKKIILFVFFTVTATIDQIPT